MKKARPPCTQSDVAAGTLHFDPATWDGSDMFLASNYWAIFVVKRVKEVLEQNKIRGCRFGPVTKMVTCMRMD